MNIKQITMLLAGSILISGCVQLTPANIDRILDRIDKEFESGSAVRPVIFVERPAPRVPGAHFATTEPAPSKSSDPTENTK